jgi:hypothetical protein
MGRKLLPLLAGLIAPALLANPAAPSPWELGFLVRDDHSEGVIASWGTSVGVFAGMPRQLSPGLEIVPRLAARVAWFDRYRGSSRWPAYGSPPSVSEAGRLYAVEGSLAIRAFWGEGVRRYVGVSGGAMVAHLGKVSFGGWRPLSSPGLELIAGSPSETGRAVAKIFVGPSVGVRSRPAQGEPGVGIEASYAMSTDGDVRWAQLVTFVVLH